MATSAHKAVPPSRSAVENLPDDLLLRVFGELARIGPAYPPEEQEVLHQFPFRTFETANEPHPGLRSYPFLSQVCRRWHNVLSQAGARQLLWREVVVDFGHELITAVHTPIAWSDQRPSDEEFRKSFAATKLSASRILRFVEDRRCCVQRVVLKNSEGYFSDDGEFVSLQTKHNFSLAHFGMLLGMLRTSLIDLQVQHCADFFNAAGLAVIACLPSLKRLRLEDVRTRVDQTALCELSKLTQLEELSLTGEDSEHSWLVGIDHLPKAWSSLTRLRRLDLRGHRLLVSLPPFISELPLRHLDVSYCRQLDILPLTQLTQLSTLALQGLNLTEAPTSVAEVMQGGDARRGLPRGIGNLTNLVALNLADNGFVRVPPMVSKLGKLQFLDLSSNPRLHVSAPLNTLSKLKELHLVDMRGIHAETNLSYWSESKCASMRHVSAFSKNLKRRTFPGKVLMDYD